jgi:predicted NBD/HSP70 family sugar kinase
VSRQHLRRLTSPKRDSRGQLFGLIHAERQTSRTRLAHLSGMSKGAVSGIVGDLLADGLILEVGKHDHGGVGRRQVLLEIDPRAGFVLGAQLGDDACTVVLADLYARLEREVVIPVRGTSPEESLDAVQEGAQRLRSEAGAGVPVLGLGVGAAGSVDAAGRRITLAVPFGWRDVPVADVLEDRLGLPVRVANRAKVAALWEHWARLDRGVDNLAYVHAGNGIVAGLVLGGALYFGQDGLAGELGHVTVVPDGPMCECGNQGCLHTLASGAAIVQQVRAKARLAGDLALVQAMNATSAQGALERVLAAAREDDRVACEVLADAGRYLGIAIANLVTLFNPQVVVIGGAVGRAGACVLDPLRREVQRRALPDSAAGLEIAPSTFPGEEAGALGAAALFLQRREVVETIASGEATPRQPAAQTKTARIPA